MVMMLMKFIITLVRESRNLPTSLSAPPARLVAKPNRIENTIRGSMALRLSRPTKSSVVKKLTIISEMVAYSPISSVAMFCQGSKTGGKSLTAANMMIAAIMPVTTKMPMLAPMILPARPRLDILAIDPAMDANTSGTTTQNIILINTVPNGLMACPNEGNNMPTIAPRTIPPIIRARKA